MKKAKLFLLLTLLAAALPFAKASTYSSALAEEGDPEPVEPIVLEFDEDFLPEYNRHILTCTNYFPAEIVETFKAPGGSVFNLSLEKEELDVIMDKIKTIPEYDEDDRVCFTDVIIRRTLNDASMYSESDCRWDLTFDELEDYIYDKLTNMTLYEVDEKTTEFDVSGGFTIEVYTPGDFTPIYEYNFSVPAYHATPYKNGDLVHARITTYERDDENRITVFANAVGGIFNPKYGFKTDGRTVNEWSETGYDEEYVLTIIDKGTGVVLGYDTNCIEISPMPSRPMTVYATLSFFSEGQEYTFVSNEVVVEEKVLDGLLDGFNNRDTIGLEDRVQHFITIPTIFPIEDMFSLRIKLYYYENDGEVVIGYHDYSKGVVDDGTNPNIWFCLSSDFFDFEIKFTKVGEYKIYAMIEGHYNFFEMNDDNYMSKNRWCKTIKVVQNAVTYTSNDNDAFVVKAYSNDKEITEGISSSSVSNLICAAGGAPIILKPEVANDLLDANELHTFNNNGNELPGCVKVTTEEDGRKITVVPYSKGTASLVISTFIKTRGRVQKVYNFRIVDDISNSIFISVKDEFHYSGENLTASIAFEKEKYIANLKIEWSVLDKDEKEVSFVDNGNFSITLVEPIENDYTIIAMFNGFEISRTTVKVRGFNVDQFVQDNILWLFFVALGICAVAIILKVFLTKKNTIIEQIDIAYFKLEQIDLTDSNSGKQLSKVKLLLQAVMSYSNDLNMDGMNQYEKTIRYLTKTLDSVKSLEKNRYELSNPDAVLEQAKKDLSKALIVVTDIQRAKAIAEENSVKANTNNYAKLEEQKKPRKFRKVRDDSDKQ